MYKNKLTPEQALREIKLRMKYDSKKTLNENLESLNEVDISGDIRDIKDEISSFNTDEASIIKILQNYKSKNDFDKLAQAYKEKYGTDIGVAIYSVINSNDRNESQQLKDWAKTIGIDAKAAPTNDGRGTFQWTLTSGVLAPSTATDNTKNAVADKVDKAKDVVTKDGKAKDVVTKDGTVPKVTPPAGLDVKKFQDWLDKNKAGWATGYKDGILNQGQNGGGYGRFGPRTQKQWNNQDVRKEFEDSLKGGTTTTTANDFAKESESVFGSTPDEFLQNN